MSTPEVWKRSFPGVPDSFVNELFLQYDEQVNAWYVRDWEKVGLKAGKIAEIVYSFLDALGKGAFPSKPSKPANFPKACADIEQKYTNLDRSLRVQIPRALVPIYELRNNRSVGHIGGAVNPNDLDGEYFYRSSKWVICELSRSLCERAGVAGQPAFFYSVNVAETPLVWERDEIIRVLRPELGSADKVVIILAHAGTWMPVGDLQDAVEYKNSTDFKRKVLRKAHEKKLIEYDANESRAMILPAGSARARSLHH